MDGGRSGGGGAGGGGGGGEGWSARPKDLLKALHLQAGALRSARAAALAQLSELQVDEHALLQLLAREDGEERVARARGGGGEESPPPPPQGAASLPGVRRSARQRRQVDGPS